jgi:hypothetical protein
VDEQVRAKGGELRLGRLRRGYPHLNETGAAPLHGKRYGLAVHAGREGDEHANHGAQLTSPSGTPAAL